MIDWLLLIPTLLFIPVLVLILVKKKVEFIFKIWGFRSKNTWKMILATLVYTIIFFIIMTIILTKVRGTVFDREDVYDCKQGRYRISHQVKEEMELKGQPAKSINMVNDGINCEVLIELEEPIELLGSKVKVIPLMTCGFECMKGSVKNGLSKLEAIDHCCQ